MRPLIASVEYISWNTQARITLNHGVDITLRYVACTRVDLHMIARRIDIPNLTATARTEIRAAEHQLDTPAAMRTLSPTQWMKRSRKIASDLPSRAFLGSRGAYYTSLFAQHPCVSVDDAR